MQHTERVNQVLRIQHREGYKSIVDTYILTIVLGFTGAHHFYLGRPWFLMAYFVTFGLLGFGWIVDICRVKWLVNEANARRDDSSLENRKYLCDAYVLWFPCGLLGFHLFYLRRPILGLLYFFTLGLFGLGWIIDGFRIPSMVREENEKHCEESAKKKCAIAAFMFALSPAGIFGAHYYYLNKPWWGLLYTFTVGLFGIGWIVDWFRCFWLIERAEQIRTKQVHPNTKYLDDICLLWFPCGLFGLHHFYLGRHGWGLLYFTTVGLVGVGWLVDLFRLKAFINDHNDRIHTQLLEDEQNNGASVGKAVEANISIIPSDYSHDKGNPPPSYDEAVALNS